MRRRSGRRALDLAEAVGRLPNGLGVIASDLLERAGGWVADSTRPSGRVWAWVGSTVAAGAELCAALLKGALDLLAAAVSVAPRIVMGLVARRPRLAFRGLVDPVSATLGAAIVALGKAVALVQVGLGLQASSRPLTPAEALPVRQVFASLPLRTLRVVAGRAGLFGLNHRPFVLGNTVYLKRCAPDPGLLVHEATHVWQYRHRGAGYAFDAIVAQTRGAAAYDWAAEMDRREHWEDLNPEAQGQLLEDHYRSGLRNTLASGGKDYGTQARQALEAVRARRRIRRP